MTYIISAVAVLTIIISMFVIIAQNRKKRKEQKVLALRNVSDIAISEMFISVDGNSAIAIDKNTKMIAYVNAGNRVMIYPHTAIIESEISEDSVSVSKMSASRLGSYVVGGYLGGVGGAIVGGLSGRQTASNEVKQIKLKFRLNDLNNPGLTITFMSELSYLKTKGWQGARYRQCSEQANHWHDILSVLIKSADKEAQEKLIAGQNNLIQAVSNTPQMTLAASGTVADELTKLHSLKEKGVLSEDEFNIRKGKLLNS